MKWFVIKIASLLLIGIAITEVHMIIYLKWKETAELQYALWMDRNYKEKIGVLWYIYELSNILKNIIWTYAFSLVADLISHKLCNILMVFFFYYGTQLAFYLWNRNTSAFSNFIVYLYILIAIGYLLMPDRKGGKLININDY